MPSCYMSCKVKMASIRILCTRQVLTYQPGADNVKLKNASVIGIQNKYVGKYGYPNSGMVHVNKIESGIIQCSFINIKAKAMY